MQEIQDLRRRLDEAEKRADEAVKKAQTDKMEEQKRKIADLEEELSNSRIEKRLVEDRVKKEMSDVKGEYSRHLDKARLIEMELKSEVQVFITSILAVCSNKSSLKKPSSRSCVLRVKEASASTGTDAQAKLLRQIETLQSQYALASENWQGIESS